MRINVSRWLLCTALLIFASPKGSGQGTVEDYRRAESFQTGAQRKLITAADVTPHWIAKSSRLWYRAAGPKKTEFILVDAVQNTSAPAFDHERLAAALAKAAKQEVLATKLPFDTFEFVDDAKSIRFHIHDAEWTCTLANYECTKNPQAKKENEY